MKYKLTISKSYISIDFVYDSLKELGDVIESLSKSLVKEKDGIAKFTIVPFTGDEESEDE